jgi:hypothetical protein
MHWEIDWSDPAMVVCHTFGKAEVEGFIRGTEEIISDARFRPGMGMITDHTNLDMSSFTADDVERLAELESAYGDRLGDGRMAIVAGVDSPLTFGLLRMWEAYVGNALEFPVHIFSELDDALAWVREGLPP